MIGFDSVEIDPSGSQGQRDRETGWARSDDEPPVAAVLDSRKRCSH